MNWSRRWARTERALETVEWDTFRRNKVLMDGIETPMTQLETWKERARGVPSWMLREHPAGDPDTVRHEGLDVTATSIRHGVTAHRIATLHQGLTPVRILEIGGGYGGLMRVLVEMFPGVEVYLADGPPLLSVQKFYLKETCGVTAHTWRGDVEVDLVVNTNSFGEMPNALVAEYFDLIQGRLNDYGSMYVSNRTERDTDFSAYPYDARWTHQVCHPYGARHWVECMSMRNWSANSPHPSGMLNGT